MASYLSASHWLVAVPNEFGAAKSSEKFKSAMIEKAGRHLAVISPFEVPLLKVGTLDSLMSLTDELNRVDNFVESVLKKVERQVAESYTALKTQEILSKRKADDDSAVVVAPLGLRCAGKPVNEYISRFKWDVNTWDPREPMPELVKRMTTAAERIDADMRQYAQSYQEKKSSLQGAERKRSGNLMVASLDDIITPSSLNAADAEWMPADSDFLASRVCVVAKAGEEAFLSGYAKFAGDAVPVGPEGKREAEKTGPAVPGSARKVAEDKDGYVLYVVVVLKKHGDDFNAACRERRVTVREFEYMPSQAGQGAKQVEAQARDTTAALSLLKDVSRARYEESVSLWMHLKAVRVFVEAVLRYGLPVSFTAMLFRVDRQGSSNAASTGRKLFESVQAGWASLSAGSRLLDEASATSAAGDMEDDGGKADPVIAGITDAPGSALPFVMLDFDVHVDTAAQAHK